MKALVVQLLPHRQSVARDLLLSSLALLSAGLLVFELTAELAPEQTRLLYTVDFAIALLFLMGFIYEYTNATDKKKFFRHNWYLLIASIPITGGVYQALRSIQLVRLLRIVRLYARVKALSEETEALSKHSSRYIAVALFAVIIIFVGAAAFYQLEQGVNDGVSTFFDAVWWATVTSTSVGYGDITPQTDQGRIVAMGLMFFGLAMLGTIVGVVSNYFLTTSEVKADAKPAKK